MCFLAGQTRPVPLPQLRAPLLLQGAGYDDEETSTALRPVLTEHETCLDRLAETNLIGQEDALTDGRAQGEQRRFDLVGVEIHTGVEE